MSELTCGVVAGTTSAALFSPVDRALFLAHVNKRPFLQRQNFTSPFQGINIVVLQKVVTSGLCFPLEDVVRRNSPIGVPGSAGHNFVAGTITGSVIAIVANPLSCIMCQKWKTQSSQGNAGIGEMAKQLYIRQGMHGFTRGLSTTLGRDLIWGGIWSSLRHEIPKWMGENELDEFAHQKPGAISFMSNVLAAGLATIISSPFNYARNLQYGQCLNAKQALCTTKIFQHLWEDARVARNPLLFIARRLTIGWGTLRVSFSLAISSQIYNKSVQLIGQQKQ